MVFRILLLIGLLRTVTRAFASKSDEERLKLNSVDRAVLAWVLVSVVTFTLLYQSVGAFVNRMGFAYSVLGTYFFCRLAARDLGDVDRIIKTLAVACTVVAAFMAIEQHTGRNVFSVFGGIPAITPVREGRIRSQGPFAHAITAGTFGATLLPLFAALWWTCRAKPFSVLGVLGGITMVMTCASATPLIAVAACLVALLLWPLRANMHLVRWGIALGLVGLHLVMKAPVWALIGRVDIVGGSSGYHRYQLVDQAIRHFPDWWLFGAANTESWGFLMHDTANAFVDVAVTGGVLSLGLFVAILARCFASVGWARKAAEGTSSMLERYYWGWGSWLFANVVSFFGIIYFDQSSVVWYTLLAMLSASTTFTMNRSLVGVNRNQDARRVIPLVR